jgi:hypothetical protein
MDLFAKNFRCSGGQRTIGACRRRALQGGPYAGQGRALSTPRTTASRRRHEMPVHRQHPEVELANGGDYSVSGIGRPGKSVEYCFQYILRPMRR